MNCYIDLDGALNCFVRDLTKIFNEKGYMFSPNNKSIYLVDTIKKEVIGIDEKTLPLQSINSTWSWKKIKNLIT